MLCSANDDNSPPDLATATVENSSAETKSPLERRRSDAMSNSENADVLDMPPLLVNSSSTFQNQNRWLSGISHHRATFEEAYTPAPSYASHASFTELEPVTTSSQAQFSTMKDTSQDPRPPSDQSSQLKQGSQLKYE